MRGVLLPLLAAAVGLGAYSEETQWEEKPGFIAATTDDLDVVFVTLDDAKRRCAANHRCEAITHRIDAVDSEGRAHFYLKAGKSVAESDRSWASHIKRAAGLMDVVFTNPFPFPLELCWVDMTAAATPMCYGAAAARSERNLTSFAGHHFVSKRLVWTGTAPPGGGPIEVDGRVRAQVWESPLRPDGAHGSAHGLNSSATATLRVHNALEHPVEVRAAMVPLSLTLSFLISRGLALIPPRSRAISRDLVRSRAL